MSSTQPSAAALEICDLCRAPLAEEHQHLREPGVRELQCVCDACAILFGSQGQTKYKRVPRRIRFLADFRLTDVQWNGLTIPIGIAFFVTSSKDNRVVAIYPSPGGPIESQPDVDAWQEIVADNPIVNTMETDVEGLLAYRVGEARDYFLLPIDECFKLSGLIRLHWKGLSGGAALWDEVGKFLEHLKFQGTH